MRRQFRFLIDFTVNEEDKYENISVSLKQDLKMRQNIGDNDKAFVTSKVEYDFSPDTSLAIVNTLQKTLGGLIIKKED